MTTLSACVTGVSGCAAVVPRLLPVSTSDSGRIKGGCMQGLAGEFNSKCLQRSLKEGFAGLWRIEGFIVENLHGMVGWMNAHDDEWSDVRVGLRGFELEMT